jgi:hypothetical protein
VLDSLDSWLPARDCFNGRATAAARAQADLRTATVTGEGLPLRADPDALQRAGLRRLD